MKLASLAAVLVAAMSALAVPAAETAEPVCYMEAAEHPVYVRVFNATEYGAKTDEIWSGWIEPFQRVPVPSRHGNIIYDYKTAPEGVYRGSFRRICDEDEVIRVVP